MKYLIALGVALFLPILPASAEQKELPPPPAYARVSVVVSVSQKTVTCKAIAVSQGAEFKMGAVSEIFVPEYPSGQIPGEATPPPPSKEELMEWTQKYAEFGNKLAGADCLSIKMVLENAGVSTSVKWEE